MVAWIMAHLAWIGWGVSELLSFMPGVKQNGVFQLVFSILKSLVAAVDSSSSAPKLK